MVDAIGENTIQMFTHLMQWFTGSNPVLTTIDNGFPHSTDVDNPEWNRNSPPCAEDLVKLKTHLRLERDGYSIIIKDIVLFP